MRTVGPVAMTRTAVDKTGLIDKIDVIRCEKSGRYVAAFGSKYLVRRRSIELRLLSARTPAKDTFNLYR